MTFPLRWILSWLLLSQVAKVDRGHNGALSVFLEGRQGGTLRNNVVAPVDVLLLVYAAVGPDQKDRKLLDNLAEMLVSDHAHLILLDALAQFIILDLEHELTRPDDGAYCLRDIL